jgi:predicted transcriptional regulator
MSMSRDQHQPDEDLEEEKPTRLSVELSPELNRALVRLARETHGTKSEVLRKSIALMEVAVEARKAGKKFGVAEKDQPLTTEIVGLGV